MKVVPAYKVRDILRPYRGIKVIDQNYWLPKGGWFMRYVAPSVRPYTHDSWDCDEIALSAMVQGREAAISMLKSRGIRAAVAWGFFGYYAEMGTGHAVNIGITEDERVVCYDNGHMLELRPREMSSGILGII